LQGVYELEIEQYPDLLEDYGSVMIKVYNSKLNYYEEIYVTRVPENIKAEHFSILRNICPHEGQYVLPMHPITKTFTCSGHGSVFNVTGNYQSGPAAADLTNYQYYAWEPGDKYLKILFDFYDKTGITENEQMHIYLKNSHPNPCGDYTNIFYGTDVDSYINYEIFDLQSNSVLKSKKEYKVKGDYSEKINLQNLPNGVYILNLYMNGIRTNSLKINKSKD